MECMKKNKLDTSKLTPFERAEVGRAKSQLLLVTHYAVKELVQQLDECTAAIDKWKETVASYNSGVASKADLEADLTIATQALKDQKLYESALIVICDQAAKDLGLEA